MRQVSELILKLRQHALQLFDPPLNLSRGNIARDHCDVIHYYLYSFVYVSRLNVCKNSRVSQKLVRYLKRIHKPLGTVNYELNISHFSHNTTGNSIRGHDGMLLIFF